MNQRADGVYAVDVPVPQGRVHFKFIVNGNWRPSCDYGIDDDGCGTNGNNFMDIAAAGGSAEQVQTQELERTLGDGADAEKAGGHDGADGEDDAGGPGDAHGGAVAAGGHDDGAVSHAGGEEVCGHEAKQKHADNGESRETFTQNSIRENVKTCENESRQEDGDTVTVRECAAGIDKLQRRVADLSQELGKSLRQLAAEEAERRRARTGE